MAVTLSWAVLTSIASAAPPAGTLKALKSTAAVQAVPAPPAINRHVIRQRIAAERGKVAQPTPLAGTQVDLYPPLQLESKPRAPLPSAVAKELERQAAAQLQQRKEATAMQSRVALASFTPLCPTLSINTLYTLNGPQMGNAYCYHFAVAQKAKSTALLRGQNANTDFALTLLKDDGANNLSVVAISDVIGNGDEFITALTEPGNYYWYMEPYATDGTPINFGVVVNAQIDAYELNDIPALATVLPDKLNTIYGNSDNTDDLDHYLFTSVRGQDVVVMLEGVNSGTSGRWITEISGNGATWQTVQNDSYTSIGNLQQNQPVYVRVRPNPTATWSAATEYRLYFGSKAAAGTHSVSGESNLVRIPYSTPYLTTQVYRQMTWGASVRDSKGSPLPGVQATLTLWPNNNFSSEYVAHQLEMNNGGAGFKTINMSDCSGDNNVIFTNSASGQSYQYRAYFNIGAWRIDVLGGPDAGVGGPNYPTVTLGHICSMDIVH